VSSKITGKFKIIWEIHSLLTTPDPWPRVQLKVGWREEPLILAIQLILELTEG